MKISIHLQQEPINLYQTFQDSSQVEDESIDSNYTKLNYVKSTFFGISLVLYLL